jgi:hypothetical protein
MRKVKQNAVNRKRWHINHGPWELLEKMLSYEKALFGPLMDTSWTSYGPLMDLLFADQWLGILHETAGIASEVPVGKAAEAGLVTWE